MDNKSRTKSFLVGLLKFGGLLTVVVLAPAATPVVEKFFIKKKKFDRREFNRTINRLERIGMIKKQVENGKITIKLSPKGTKRATEYALEEMEIIKPLKWDKKWRIIIFDIPEDKRKARNSFKRRLDILGFTLIQKSIYMHPYPCEKEIRYLVGVYGVKPYVKYLLADYLDGQEKYINTYKLYTQ